MFLSGKDTTLKQVQYEQSGISYHFRRIDGKRTITTRVEEGVSKLRLWFCLPVYVVLNTVSGRWYLNVHDRGTFGNRDSWYDQRPLPSFVKLNTLQFYVLSVYSLLHRTTPCTPPLLFQTFLKLVFTVSILVRFRQLTCKRRNTVGTTYLKVGRRKILTIVNILSSVELKFWNSFLLQ